MVFGGLQPSEVDRLTGTERDAIITALNERNEQQRQAQSGRRTVQVMDDE